MLKKKCLTCGKEFFKSPSKSMRAWNEEVKYCSMGCSQTVFKKGLVPWNKGKTGYLSDDAIKKMSEANKGQHLGREFKKGDKPLQHKAGRKCFRCTGEAWNAGKVGLYKHSKETKRKISLAHKGKKPKNFNDLMKKIHSKEPTGIEVKVYNELKRRGFLFERQKIVGNKFIVDAFIPELNLVIEADGDYWHSLDKSKERDKRKDIYLHKRGFDLLRLTGTEINNGDFKDRLPTKD